MHIISHSAYYVKEPGMTIPARAANIPAQAPVKPAPRGGRTLIGRVLEALVSEEYAFCFEFSDGDVDVFGCYKATDLTQPEYALEVVAGQIVKCNCPDAQCRKRICKHAALLCLATGYGVMFPELAAVTVATIKAKFHTPRPVAARERMAA